MGRCNLISNLFNHSQVILLKQDKLVDALRRDQYCYSILNISECLRSTHIIWLGWLYPNCTLHLYQVKYHVINVVYWRLAKPSPGNCIILSICVCWNTHLQLYLKHPRGRCNTVNSSELIFSHFAKILLARSCPVTQSKLLMLSSVQNCKRTEQRNEIT